MTLGGTNRTTLTGPITLSGTNTFSVSSTTYLGRRRQRHRLAEPDAGNALVLENPNNTYSGGTNLGSTGQLQVNTSDVLNSSGTIVSGPLGVGAINLTTGVFQNGNTSSGPSQFQANLITLHNQVNLINANFTIGGGNAGAAGDITLAGPVTVTGNQNIVSVSANVTLTLAGVVSGTGSITKAGAGRLQLEGANTFTGGVNIGANTILSAAGVTMNQGPVIVGNNAALGTGLVTLAGGTLQDDGRAAYTIANPVLLAAAPFAPTAPNAVGGTATFYNLNLNPSSLAALNFNAAPLLSNAFPVYTRVDASLNYPTNGNGLSFNGGTGNLVGFPVGIQVTNDAGSWTGSLNIFTAGTYTFDFFNSDDASQLFIDGTSVVAAGVTTTGTTGTIFLAPGLHSFQAIFYQIAGGASMLFSIRSRHQ